MTPSSNTRQRGVATIFVAMIMLIFITLMVTTAYNLSTVNLKAVSNVQVREEAIAAAQKSIELAIGGTFWNPAIEQNFDIDINNDTINDYQVTIAAPTCQRATEAILTSTSSVTLPGFSSAAAWNTVWELDATATEEGSGTRVRVRQGVRVLMSEADKNLYCG
jgi:Flp pilus assembly protein TadG